MLIDIYLSIMFFSTESNFNALLCSFCLVCVALNGIMQCTELRTLMVAVFNYFAKLFYSKSIWHSGAGPSECWAQFAIQTKFDVKTQPT